MVKCLIDFESELVFNCDIFENLIFEKCDIFANNLVICLFVLVEVKILEKLVENVSKKV